MTIEEARQKVRNYLANSTSCCYEGGEYGEPKCAIHTAEWIEREAQEKFKAAKEAEEFHREWTSKLGDLVPKMSARKVGERLVELGLRVYHDDGSTYRASAAALDEDIARIIDEKGYPKVFWNRERTVAIILDGPSAEQQSNWEALNHNRDEYENELARLDEIIDHVAYLYPSEISTVNLLLSGGGSVKSFRRKALKRAYYDQKNGVALKLRKLEATTTGQ